MADLDQRLRALATDAFPPAPDVGAAVATRIEDERSALAAPRRLRTIAVALLLVLLPTAAVAAVPGTRHAVLDWIGLAHVRVERLPCVPKLPGLVRAELGQRVASAGEAGRRAGFAVAVPRALGAPDAVYVTRDGIVSLAYTPRDDLPRDPETGLGALVTELGERSNPAFLGKAAGPGTVVRAVSVDGARGVFMSGTPHALIVQRPRGVIASLAPRLSGNALAFERAGLLIRLEGHFGLSRALALARSL